MDDLISVIVPVYKVEEYLARCIESIIKQTYENFEMILVDDGSPDNCGKICDKYAAKDERIKVIHQRNSGLSAARNAGINIMRGKYVTFIDSDDFVHETYLEVMYRLIKKYGIGVCQVSFEQGKADIFPKLEGKTEIKCFRDSELFGNRNVKITAWAKLYEASLISTVKFPVGKINEDEFFTYKPVAYARGIIVSSERLYYYYNRSGSIMNTKKDMLCLDFQEAYRERIDFFLRRNDFVAVDMSYKEYAIRLMLLLSECMVNPDNRNDKEQLIIDFRSAYSSIKNKKKIDIKERLILWGFSKCPYIAGKLIWLFRQYS